MPRGPFRTSPFAVLSLAALLAVAPMLLYGTSCGHDFDFHLLSWLEAASQIGHGAYPHWAYTPAYNAGEPRFIFYPPLSWLLGALLGITLPWAIVPSLFIWIALTLAGCTFYRLARRYVEPRPATLAASLYLANPYMLFTAYERSAFAELLAAAFLPMLLDAALPAPARSSRSPSRRIVSVAIPLALVWLTNAPAAVMFTYALAFLTLVRLLVAGSAPPGRAQLALTTCAGTVLGLALAAFYIVPAACERRFVQISMVVMQGMRVNDHFLFHRMAGQSADDLFHNAVVRTASLVALGLVAGIAVALLFASRSQQHRAELRREVILPLALLTAVIAFLLTPPSLPLWHLLPQMQFLQFPWRLGALLGVISALVVALALPQTLRNASLWLAPLAALALAAPACLAFHQPCDPEDAIPARVALFHSRLGTESTDEYTPAAADPDALHPHDPPYWLLPLTGTQMAMNASPPAGAAPGQAPAHLDLTLPEPGTLVLNRREYPHWKLFRNHVEITLVLSRDDGLILVALPPGVSHIDLEWHALPDQLAGDVISGAALVVLLLLTAVSRQKTSLLASATAP